MIDSRWIRGQSKISAFIGCFQMITKTILEVERNDSVVEKQPIWVVEHSNLLSFIQRLSHCR